jgi:hypothetical protein
MGAQRHGADAAVMGPVELAVIRFPDTDFGGDAVADAMQAVAEGGAVRVLDLVFIARDAAGSISVLELDELAGGLIPDEDLQAAAARLEPGTSLALVLLEDVWARGLLEALDETGAELLSGGRLPRGAVEAAFAVAPANAS